MTGRKFFVILGVLFLIALAVYIFTTPSGNAYPLIGVVDGNDVIVSPQITDRMIKLNVDEGSVVTKGELIAELDPAELQAQAAAQDAAIGSLRAQVVQAQANLSLTDSQTAAALNVAAANYTASQAQLEQARATSDLNDINMKREVSLFASGVVAAQDRDSAVATFKASDANVRSLVDQVKSQQAALAVAVANRKQVDVLRSQIASTQAQLKQAIAMEAEDETQTGLHENLRADRRHCFGARCEARRGGSGGQSHRGAGGYGRFVGARGRAGDVYQRYSIWTEDADQAAIGRNRSGRCFLQGSGRRFRDAARRQPHQAGHSNLRHQGFAAEPAAPLLHRHDRDGAACAAEGNEALVGARVGRKRLKDDARD